MTRTLAVAGVTLAAAAVATLLDLMAFPGSRAIGLTGNGTADAAAAIAIFRAVEIFAVALAVALMAMIVVTSLQAKPSLRSLASAVPACTLAWVVGVCAASLSPVTFFVPLAIFALLFIYTPAVALIGGRGAIAAVLESCQVVFVHARATARLAATVALIALVGTWAGALLGRWSEPAGWFVAALLQQGAAVYAGVVVAGAYRTLASDPPPAGL